MLIDINTLDIVVAIVMSLAVGVIVTTTIADAKKRKRYEEMQLARSLALRNHRA